jgi:actin-like ATPase involved in cell morphogenesis
MIIKGISNDSPATTLILDFGTEGVHKNDVTPQKIITPKNITKIVQSVLKNCPPELASDTFEKNISDGSLIKGLDMFLTKER